MPPRPVMSEANVELTKKLGSGGFGITWQAYDYVTRKEVAIKIYRPADWADEGPDGRISLRSEEHRNEYEWGLRRFLRKDNCFEPSTTRPWYGSTATDTATAPLTS